MLRGIIFAMAYKCYVCIITLVDGSAGMPQDNDIDTNTHNIDNNINDNSSDTTTTTITAANHNTTTNNRIMQNHVERAYPLSPWFVFYDSAMSPYWYNFNTHQQAPGSGRPCSRV